ncbi:MAG: sensor histidine kinase, partial [Bacteroidota bacterium]
MAIQTRKSYKFALRSSLLISLILLLLFSAYMMFYNTWNIVALALISLGSFIASFIVLQVRVERFIYRRIKKIYDDVSLLES